MTEKGLLEDSTRIYSEILDVPVPVVAGEVVVDQGPVDEKLAAAGVKQNFDEDQQENHRLEMGSISDTAYYWLVSAPSYCLLNYYMFADNVKAEGEEVDWEMTKTGDY